MSAPTATLGSGQAPFFFSWSSYLHDPSHRPVAEAIGAAAERIVVFDI